MPYIKQDDRMKFDKHVKKLVSEIESTGEINYVISTILIGMMKKHGKDYDELNGLMGVINCVQQEFYRKVAAPYEELKEKDNGGIL